MTSRAIQTRTILVSGASIAGLTLAYWLDRGGLAVTVVEQAPGVRSGGYPIDVRGTALDVIDRMGLSTQLRRAHVHSRSLEFLDAQGRPIGTLPLQEITASQAGRDVELPRGELTAMLYGLTQRSRVRYRFDDAIERLHDDGSAVDVRFRSGLAGRFDVVIGADGLHSGTRRLAFGPQESFDRDLGFCFNIFSMPNDIGLSHGGIVQMEAGRSAGAYAVRDSEETCAFLTFATQSPPFREHRDLQAQRQRTAAVFAGAGGIVPRLLQAMACSDDVYFDTVSQIRMPRWSTGRVVLAGDAAHAPSFLSGQGTSLALVGAHVLAGELAERQSVADAFAAYEMRLRPFVEANQALAIREGGPLFLPRNQAELEARHRLLASLREGELPGLPVDDARGVHESLRLPPYTFGQAP
jgi:2-polyprenyl-6-methoxyphenol hydroxylase-like FAD-dependent oxidoreductase